MSSNKNKEKDKGKGIRRAEDYQLKVPIQIPTHNQFQTLADFPPLPCKTVVSNPATKPTLENSYVVRHTKHLFLTNYKCMPSSEVIKPLIKKKHLDKSILPQIIHKKRNNFMNSF